MGKGITIRINGAYADIEGDVPPALSRHLESELCWVGTTDLSRPIAFYSREEQIVYSGCAYKAAGLIEAWLAENEPDRTVTLITPPLPPQAFSWRFRTDHLPGAPNLKRLALQADFVKAGLERRFCILQGPPGFGKTLTLAHLISEIGQPTVFIVEAAEPFEQAVHEIEGCLPGLKVGRVKGSKVDIREVNVVTIQTWYSMHKNLDPRAKILSAARLVLVDETHNAAADTYLQFLDSLTDPLAIIGVTATPYRHDDRSDLLYARLGDVAFHCPYSEAVDAEILVPMYLFTEFMPEKDYGYAKDRTVTGMLRRKQYQKVVREQVYENETRHRALLSFCDYAWQSGATCAIISDSIPHMEHLCQLDRGLVMVHGQTKPKLRKEIWEALRNRDITRVTTTLMDEATNIRSLGAIAAAAPGKSKVKLVQRQRQLRCFEGMTAQGWYKKEFGMTYVPIDRTDFLRSHSNQNIINLMGEFISQHPDCRRYDLGAAEAIDIND